MKLTLRVVVLVLLGWLLAKFVAGAPGGIMLGRKHKKGNPDWRSMRDKAGNMYVATGMQSELIATAGASAGLVGRSLNLY